MAKKKRKVRSTGEGGGARSLGTNVMATVEGNTMTLVVDLDQDNGQTPKGFVRIATTHGNVEVPGHPSIRIGMNVYDRG